MSWGRIIIRTNDIICKVKNAVVRASSSFRIDQKETYLRVIKKETDKRTHWILEQMLQNAIIAEKNGSPLCDDTGIPHGLLELGKNCQLTGEMLWAIEEGIAAGLAELPGRPMALKGSSVQQIDQSGGIDHNPKAVTMAPLIIRRTENTVITLHVLMLGGGPEIRGKTYRIFHKHSVTSVMDEICDWAVEGASLLGCTPCVLAVGVGRTHFEATSLMLESMVYGDLRLQNDLEKSITERVNQHNIGALGLGSGVTVLGTYLKIGPQRASGVRIVCIRPCCYLEPRKASIDL